jgi:hypothetical protein
MNSGAGGPVPLNLLLALVALVAGAVAAVAVILLAVRTIA